MKRLWLLLALLATPALAQDYPGWPNGATPVYVVGNGANAQVQLTIPAVAGRLNFMNSVVCTSNAATAASYVVATITGLMGGTRSVVFFVPSSTSGGNNVPLEANAGGSGVFPIPASAVNTATVFTLPALGAGNTETHCIIAGFHTRPPN
jgi:hypothetical protein